MVVTMSLVYNILVLLMLRVGPLLLERQPIIVIVDGVVKRLIVINLSLLKVIDVAIWIHAAEYVDTALFFLVVL